MALVVWRTGAWKLQIVKRSDTAGFEVYLKDGSSNGPSPGSAAIADWLAILSVTQPPPLLSSASR
jgi:hypothetical protein